MPLSSPEVVLGAALLAMFLTVNINTGFVTIVIAHVMFTMSYVVVTVKARLEGMDRHIEEAAMDLGATEWVTFRKVTLPMIAPGVAAAAMLAAAISFDDYVITSFNAGQTQTFPLFIFGATRQGVPAEVNVLATMLLIVVLGLMGLNLLIQRALARRDSQTGRLSADAGLDVEVVEAVRVDRQLDPVADRHGRAGVHDDGEGGAVVLGEQDVVVDGGGVDRVGERGGAQARRVDARDDVGLGAEPLDDLDDGGDALAELEVVRADAEHAAALDRRRHAAGAEAPALGLDQVHRG